MKSVSLIRHLESIDWDFPAPIPGSLDTVHWYPATFVPGIPGALIQALSEPKDLVFDPFAGIGTTATESLRLRRRAWIAELNPVAAFAAYALNGLFLLKTTSPDRYANLINRIDSLIPINDRRPTPLLSMDLTVASDRTLDSHLAALISPTPKQFYTEMQGKRLPIWDALRPWYGAHTLGRIQTLHKALTMEKTSAFEKIVGLTLVSAIMRPASSQTQSWGHIADNVLPKELIEKQVGELGLRWLQRLHGAYGRVRAIGSPIRADSEPWLTISVHDWTKNNQIRERPFRSVDLMVTSPPYDAAIDYILSQRLSLYLFGFNDDDISKLVKSEIGARRKRFMRTSREIWAGELDHAFADLIRLLGANCYVALILPHKTADRRDGTATLDALLRANRWSVFFKTDRSIRQLRTRQSWTSIKRETIYLYSRDGKVV